MAKLAIWDQRILTLMRHSIDLQLCDTQKEFLESIGFQPTNLRQIKNGQQSFTLEQIQAAAVKYKINTNWIFGLDNEMRFKKSADVMVQLKDVVRALDADMKKNKRIPT